MYILENMLPYQILTGGLSFVVEVRYFYKMLAQNLRDPKWFKCVLMPYWLEYTYN